MALKKRTRNTQYALHKNRLTRYDQGLGGGEHVRRDMRTKGSYLRHALADEYKFHRKVKGARKATAHLKKSMGA